MSQMPFSLLEEGDYLEPTNDQVQEAARTRYPTPMNPKAPQMSREEKIDYIAHRFKEILYVLGLDLNDHSLAKTPQRIAKMYVDEIFSGLDEEKFPAMSFFIDRFTHRGQSQPIIVKVSFHSFCEHHFVPMSGTAYVAYVPNGKLIGLSKIPRLVHYFAKRPQLQERLGAQVADALSLLLDTEDVAVSIQAQHFCVIARGIEETQSHTTTHLLRGRFESDANLQRQFFETITKDKK